MSERENMKISLDTINGAIDASLDLGVTVLMNTLFVNDRDIKYDFSDKVLETYKYTVDSYLKQYHDSVELAIDKLINAIPKELIENGEKVVKYDVWKRGKKKEETG